MRINNNLMAMNTHRQLGLNTNAGAKSIEKLSSGYRINRAGDDAAGLAISEKMRGQIRGLNQASRNSQDGISLIQTAEGALNETQAILQRMRELAVQSSNDTNVTADRDALQSEISQLVEEIDRIADTTEFNKKTLLNGDLKGVVNTAESATIESGNKDLFTGVSTTVANAKDMTYNVKVTTVSTTGAASLTITDHEGTSTTINVAAGNTNVAIDTNVATLVLSGTLAIADIGEEITFTVRDDIQNLTDDSVNLQIGANSSQVIGVAIEDMGAEALNVKNVNIESSGAAEASISAINKAIEDVSSQRASLGAVQNRLEHTIKNLDTSAENLQASESRIRDVDMAKEMMTFTKNNILQQAAQSMLAQANQAPQGVLQLLR